MSRKANSAVRDVEVLPVSRETDAAALAKPVRRSVAIAVNKHEAQAATEAILAIFKKMRTDWYELGVRVKDGIDRQVPIALGMNAMDWMRGMFGEKLSKVHRSLRIARALERMDQGVVRLLTEGNAYQLTRLPESMRTSEEWVGKARGLENKEFEEAVQDALEAKGHPKRERFTHQFPRMPITFTPLLQEVEKKLAGIMDLDLELKGDEVRFQVWERVSLMIFNAPEGVLREALVGEDGSAPPDLGEDV